MVSEKCSKNAIHNLIEKSGQYTDMKGLKAIKEKAFLESDKRSGWVGWCT